MANPLQVAGFDHVVLRCKDLQLMLDFYQDVLGCPLERTAGNLYQLRAGSGLIDLIPWTDELGDVASGTLDHFCLVIQNPSWEAIREHLKAAGIDSGEPAQRYGAGGMGLSIYIDDPEGNSVELKEAAR